MPDPTAKLTCYLCGSEIPLRGKTGRVQDPETKVWHDEEVEPAPSFVMLPLHKDGQLLLDEKGHAIPAYLCHRCGLEEQPPPAPAPPIGQQRLL